MRPVASRPKTHRVTWRSFHRSFLFTLPICGALGIGEAILESVLGGPSRLSRILPILGISVIVPIGTSFMWVPIEKPGTKGPDDLLA